MFSNMVPFQYSVFFFCPSHLSLLPVEVLVVKVEVSSRERGLGGVGEVFQDQKVSHRLPGEDKFSSYLCSLKIKKVLSLSNRNVSACLLFSLLLKFA